MNGCDYVSRKSRKPPRRRANLGLFMNSAVAATDLSPSTAGGFDADRGEVGTEIPTRRLPSRKTLLVAGAILAGVVGLSAFGHRWWTVGRFIESTDDAYVGGDITVIAPKV